MVFGTGFFLNFFIWGKHSSGAVSESFFVFRIVLVLKDFRLLMRAIMSIGAVCDNDGAVVHVVWNLIATRTSWLLLWLQEAGVRAPGQDQPDSQTGS